MQRARDREVFSGTDLADDPGHCLADARGLMSVARKPFPDARDRGY